MKVFLVLVLFIGLSFAAPTEDHESHEEHDHEEHDHDHVDEELACGPGSNPPCYDDVPLENESEGPVGDACGPESNPPCYVDDVFEGPVGEACGPGSNPPCYDDADWGINQDTGDMYMDIEYIEDEDY